MRAARTLLVYVVVVACFGAGIAAILHFGPSSHESDGQASVDRAPSAASVAPGSAAPAGDAGTLGRLLHNAREPLALLLVQVVVIVAVARGVGEIGRAHV